MMKCFTLILSIFISFEAKSQLSPSIHSQNNRAIGNAVNTSVSNVRRSSLADAYLSRNFNMVDENNRAVVANNKESFRLKSARTLGGLIGDKVSKGNAVEVNCVTPQSKYRWGKLIGTKMNGQVESIKRKGLYDFVKVKGCDYFVQSHHVLQKLQTELPTRVQSTAVARQQGAQ